MSVLGRWFGKWFRCVAVPPRGTFLVVGLGNPGPEYCNTRHNVGFRVAEHFGAALARSHERMCCRSDLTIGEWAEQKRSVAVAKPRTFMNRSGEAVECLLAKAGVESGHCLVLVDDVNLPLGRIRIRRGGSDGGHNGLKSIIGAVGRDFPRLRIGIGPAPRGRAMIDFVLGTFTDAEEEQLAQVIPRAAEAIAGVLDRGVETAMNEYN